MRNPLSVWRRAALSGLAGIIVLAAATLWASSPAFAVSAGWITSCAYTHTDQVDPIISPGVRPSAHLHDFIGATSTDENSTADSLRAGGSMCHSPGDSSAFWEPALYENGVANVPSAPQDKDALFYYTPGGTNTQPFPDGFRMVLGNSMATSPAENPEIGRGHIYWKCGPGGAPHLSQPPATCGSGSFLVEVFTFPTHWTGVEVPGNEIGQMSYTADAAHPVTLPKLQVFVRHQTVTGSIGTISYASGPWYTLHADYFFAWDNATFARGVANCINAHVDCGKDPTL